MASNYDAVDFNTTEDWDLKISENGDIAVTDTDLILSLKQQVIGILKSEEGDFQLYPTLAANLSDFIGEPNSRENAKRIEQRIKSILINGNIVQKGDLEVIVNAVTSDTVAIEILIGAIPTMYNSVEREVSMSFFFSSSDGNILWTDGYPGGRI